MPMPLMPSRAPGRWWQGGLPALAAPFAQRRFCPAGGVEPGRAAG